MIDTHAHLHFAEAFTDLDEVLERAKDAGLTHIINVGVDPRDSRNALRLAKRYAEHDIALFATAGLHPHSAAQGDAALDLIHDMAEDVVAIGECGLDYYKNHATQDDQVHALRGQLEIAQEHHLPVVFHVRDAWDDFFRILADYPEVRGVIHSFTGGPHEVELAYKHDGELFFGLNGIMTFTKQADQLEACRLIPSDRLLLETDCPYLTPVPHRGARNEPSFIPLVADFLAHHREEARTTLVKNASHNAEELFRLSLA